ncbi:hypothetical protein D3C85_1768260 [compost metagenome]
MILLNINLRRTDIMYKQIYTLILPGLALTEGASLGYLGPDEYFLYDLSDPEGYGQLVQDK